MWKAVYSGTQYSSASECIKPGICRILMRKNVSALGVCSPLITLARTCMSHHPSPQEEMLSQSSLARHSLEWINDEYQGTTVRIGRDWLIGIDRVHGIFIVQWQGGKMFFQLNRGWGLLWVCIGGEDLQLCVLTENVTLDSQGRYEEARPVTTLGKNTLGRRRADAEAQRWEWAWYSRKGQGANNSWGEEPDRRWGTRIGGTLWAVIMNLTFTGQGVRSHLV